MALKEKELQELLNQQKEVFIAVITFPDMEGNWSTCRTTTIFSRKLTVTFIHLISIFTAGNENSTS
jgi:hypothetical protein